MYKDDDVLDVLNTNTQNNNYNQGSSGDDELNILNENIKNLPSTPSKDGFSLTDEEAAAREQASLDAAAGVNHVDPADLQLLKAQQRGGGEGGEGEGEEPITSEVRRSNIVENITGTPNVTKTLATDLVEEEENINTAALYRDTLGSTAYADLKKACGLNINDSFTDFYNRTHYIPKGYEMEVKMLLIEEKRMEYYIKYASGEISKSDFLYQAYGKDLMKEAGHDLTSKLYWYKKIKNGDYTNPLESETFLTDLIGNAESLWKAETWFKDSSSKKISETLAGLSTGKEVSEEKFYEVFKEQVNALKPYFDDDIKKIMTYYQAGSLSGAFSPFVDIDGDGKFDYYYHTDGKMYAVDGSSGTGSSKCAVTYNEDGSVHCVQVHEALDGWSDSLWEGFRDFFVGFMDIGAMLWNGTAGWIYDDFIDNQQKWEAWKKRTIGDEDRVVFDSMDKWNGEDWANGICKGVGQVVGMVALIVATWGIGAAISAATSAAEAGASAGAEAAKEAIATGAKELTKESIKQLTTKLTEKAVQTLGKEASQKAISNFVASGMRAATKEFVKGGVKQIAGVATKAVIKEVAKEAGVSLTKSAIKGGALKVAETLVGQGGVGNIVSQGRSGNITSSILKQVAAKTKNVGLKKVASNIWLRSAATATEIAARDFIQVGAQLEAKNKSLQYLEEITKGTDNEIKALSAQEIWGRAGIVAGADFLITTAFRAQGSDGFTARFIHDPNSMVQKSVDEIKKGMAGTVAAAKIEGYLNHMKTFCYIDSAFDIIENVSTMGIQAAMSNPYAKTGEEMWNTAWQAVASPESIAMNLYLTYNNVHSWGGRNGRTGRINTSIYDDRLAAMYGQIKLNSGLLGDGLSKLENYVVNSKNVDAVSMHKTLQTLKQKVDETINKGKNVVEGVMNGAELLDKVFTEDLVEANKKEFLDSYGLTEEDYDNIKTLVKVYNAEASDENKIGIITGIFFEKASRKQDQAVADVYQKFMNYVSAEAKSRQDRWSRLFKNAVAGKGLSGLIKQSAVQNAEYLNRMYADVAGKIIGDYSVKVDDIFDSFVSKRFYALDALDRIDRTETEQEEYIEKEREALKGFVESDYVKTGVFTDESSFAGTTFKITQDPKTKKYKLESSYAGSSDDLIYGMFVNYEKNKDAIQALVNIGVLKSVKKEDGSVEFVIGKGGAPWFWIALDNAKHNQLLADAKVNPSLANVLNTYDAAAYMFSQEMEDADITHYDTPLITKIYISTPTDDNPNAKTVVYLMPNDFDAGMSEIFNRLQTQQGILYDIYSLYNMALNPKEYNADKAIKTFARIGSLLKEEKSMDPYYDFIKLYQSTKDEDKAEVADMIRHGMKAILANATFLTEDGKKSNAAYNREKLIYLFEHGGLPTEHLQKIREEMSSDKMISSKAGKIADEILTYIEYAGDEGKLKKVLGYFADAQENGGKFTDAQKKFIKETISEVKKNQMLYDSLKADGRIDSPILKRLFEMTGEALEDFPFGLQVSGQLEVLGKYLAALPKPERKRKINALVSSILSEEVFRENKQARDLMRQTRENLFNLITAGGEKNRVARYIRSLSDEDFIKFIAKPDDLFGTLTKDMTGGKGRYTDERFSNDLKDVQLILSVYKNKNGGYDLNKVVLDTFGSDSYEVAFFKTAGMSDTQIVKTMFKHIKNGDNEKIINFIKLALGTEDVDLDKFTINEKGKPVIKYDGKALSDIFLDNAKVLDIERINLTKERKQRIVELTEAASDYYFKGTTTRDAKNVVELNMLDFLPEYLQKAISAAASNISAYENNALKYDIDEAAKTYNSMLKGYLSGEASEQYLAYQTMLARCFANGNFILQYDPDSPELQKFLTLCGYGKDYLNLKEKTSQIKGLYFKTSATHNVEADVESKKLYAAVRKYLTDNGGITTHAGAKPKKNMINILYNLFSSVTRVDNDTKVNLMSVDYEVGKKSDGKTKTFKQTNVPLDFAGYIYDKKDTTKSFDIDQGFVDEVLSRLEKGTLIGGEQAAQYLLKMKGYKIAAGANTELNINSKNTFDLIRLVDCAVDYLTKSKHSLKSYVCTVAPSQKEEFEKFYAADANAFFKIDHNEDNVYYLVPNYDVIKGANKKGGFIDRVMQEGFNIRQILPMWTPVDMKFTKYAEPMESQYATCESLYTVLSNLNIEGFRTIKDFENQLELTYTKDSFMNVDTKAKDDYLKLCSSMTGKTISEIVAAIQSDSELNNNYYAQCLLFKLTGAIDMSNKLAGGVDPEYKELLAFANPKYYKAVGEVFNRAEFAKVFDKTYQPTSTDIASLAKAIRDELAIPGKYDSENPYTEFTSDSLGSSDIDKLNPYGNVVDFTEEGLSKLVNMLRNSEDNLLVQLSSNNGLPVHNDIVTALTLFLDSNANDKLSIPLEYYIQSTRKVREEFSSFIEALIDNPTYYELDSKDVKALKDLNNVLLEKEKIINEQLKPRDVVDKEKLKTTVLYALNSSKNPTVIVDPEKGFMSISGQRKTVETVRQILDLVSNREFANNEGKNYIKASSVNLRNIETFNDLKEQMVELFNRTVPLYSDKPGSVMVHNMDVDEAVAESMLTMLSFSEITRKLITEDLGISISNNKAFDNMLDELAIKCNLLTTGMTYESEYAGAQIVIFDDSKGLRDDQRYRIVPLTLSVGDEEKSLFQYFLGKSDKYLGDVDSEVFSFANINEKIKKNNKLHYFLIKTDKNSFVDNVNGYKNGSMIVDLGDKVTQGKIMSRMVNKAIYDQDDWIHFKPTTENIQKIMLEYYMPDQRSITTRDLWKNVANSFRKLGITESVINTIYPTIRSLNVANETNLTEQSVHDFFSTIVKSFKGKTSSVEYDNIRQALIHGITGDVLTYEDEDALEKAYMKIYYQFEKDGYDLDDIARCLDKPEDSVEYQTTVEKIKGLSTKQKSELIKAVMFRSLNGQDLNPLLNSRNGHSLYDVAKSIGRTITDTATGWVSQHIDPTNPSEVNVYNARQKANYVSHDSEWLFDGGDTEQGTYQLGFVIKNIKNNTSSKFSILVAENILGVDAKGNKIKNLKHESFKGLKGEEGTIFYKESPDQFEKKQAYVRSKKNFIGDVKNFTVMDLPEAEDNGKIVMVVNTPAEAYALFKKLCDINDVKLAVGFNNKATNIQGSEIADDYFINKYIPDFYKNVDNIDVRKDVLQKVYSRTSELWNAQSMEDINRRLGKSEETHDGVDDAIDADDLYTRIIDNALETKDLYTARYKQIAKWFGESEDSDQWSDGFKKVLKGVNFDGMKFSDDVEEAAKTIDVFDKNAKFQRSNASIKSVVDAYNILAEKAVRRIKNKELRSVDESVLDIFSNRYTENYMATVKDKYHSNQLKGLIIGLADMESEGLFSKVMSKNNNEIIDASPEELRAIQRAFRRAIAIISTTLDGKYEDGNEKQQGFKKMFKNSKNQWFNTEIKLMGNAPISEAFFSQDFNKVVDLIASVNEIDPKKLKSYIKNQSQVESLIALNLFNKLKNPANNLFNQDEMFADSIEGKMYLGLGKQLAEAVGLTSGKHSDTVIAGSMSEELKRELVDSLINIYGTTQENLDRQQQRVEATTIDGRRRTILSTLDSYQKGVRQAFLDPENGLFRKGLRNHTALWTMGHERLNVTHSGEEGTIYIGEKLLTGSNSFRDLFGVYSADDVNHETDKNTFYTLVWRQPLQHSANVSIMKVRVVKGDTFSMSTKTMRNYFNGDWDGDSVFFSHPTALSNKYGQEMFEMKTIPYKLFNNLWDDDTKIKVDRVINSSDKYVEVAKEVFMLDEVKNAFISAMQGGKISDLERVFIKAFTDRYSGSTGLSKEDWLDLAKEYLDVYGVKKAKLNNKYIRISNNQLYSNEFRKDPALKKIYDEMIANTKLFSQHNQENPGTDAVEVGQAAKNFKQKRQEFTDDVSKIFYQSSFTMDNDDIDYLAMLINKNAISFDKLAAYGQALYDSDSISDSMYAYFQKALVNLKDTLNVAKPSDKADAAKKAALYLVNLAQFLQQDSQQSARFSNLVNTAGPELMDVYNEQDKQSVVALYTYMKQQGYDMSDIDSAFFDRRRKGDFNFKNGKDNSPHYMLAASSMFKKLFTADQAKNYIKFTNNDNIALANIFSNIMAGDTNGMDIRDNVRVISTAERVTGKTKDAIGLGEATVAVQVSGQTPLKDSMYIIDAGENSLAYTRALDINLYDFTFEEKKKLIALMKSQGENALVLGSVLNEALDMNLRPEQKYQICGIKDGLDQMVDVSSLKDKDIQRLGAHSHFVILESTKLCDIAEDTEVKIGLAGAKAMKGTAIFSEGMFKTEKVQLVVSKNLWDEGNLSPSSQYEEIGTGKDANGNTYKLYKVKDLALLNSMTIDSQSVAKNRKIDSIGIIQGGHNFDAMFSFGNLYMMYDKSKKQWSYNPTGYNELRDTLNRYNLESRYQDVNGANIVRLCRMAYMLDSIKNEEALTELCRTVTHGACSTKQDTLDYLYAHGDLGGDFGESREAVIYSAVLRDEGALSRLKASISNKNNAIGRVAFSEEINSALENRYASYFDDSVDTEIISKHAKPRGDDRNIRINNMIAGSDNDDIIAHLEGSQLDANNSYVARSSIARLLMEEMGQKYNRTLIKQAYDNGILKPIIGKLGNLYNGYKFIADSQGIEVPGFEEKQSTIKAGMKSPYSMYLKNLENLQLAPVCSSSVFDVDPSSYKSWADNTEDYYGTWDGNKTMRRINDFNSLAHMMPFFTDGSDEQITDAMNLYKKMYQENINRKTMTVNPEGDDLMANIDTAVEDRPRTMEEQKAWIQENTKSPKAAELLSQKQKFFNEDFDDLSVVDFCEQIKKLNRNVLEFESTREGKELIGLINEFEDIRKDYDNYNAVVEGNNIFSLLRDNVTTDDVIKTIGLCSNNNGIKLVNSWFKTWGFKAKDNKDIALGTQTIRIRQKIQNNKESLLGSEHTLLHYFAKVNTELYIQLNKYMEMEKDLETYDELTVNKEANLKKLGKKQYDELLESVKKVIPDDEARLQIIQAQKDMIKDNVYLKAMVSYATAINYRLMTQARAKDPFAFLGWFAAIPESKDKAWLAHSYVKVKTEFNDKALDGLEYDLTKMTAEEAASKLFNKDLGYLGMVEYVAGSLAEAETFDQFANYMKASGYMRNFQIYQKAQDKLNSYIVNYFSKYADGEPDEDGRLSMNEFTFRTLKYAYQSAGLDTTYIDNYNNEYSIYQLFNYINDLEVKLQQDLGCSSSADIMQKIYENKMQQTSSSGKAISLQQEKIHNAYLTTLDVIVKMMQEQGVGKDIYKEIYNDIYSYAKANDMVLVNNKGQKVNPGDEVIVYNDPRILDRMMQFMKEDGLSAAQRIERIGRQALTGDIYLMDSSVADQLEKKVFSSRVNSKLNAIMKKAKNLATSLVMASPFSLLDRIINFPFFDAGVVGSADINTYKWMGAAQAAVNKYAASGGTLTDEAIAEDPIMMKLMRFIAATGQDLIQTESVRGEKIGKSSIPGVRQYLKATNVLYNMGNIIPRFAYYLNLSDTMDYNIDRKHTGVTYHMYDSINEIKADESLYKSDLYKNEADPVAAADMDARIAQIIAEHNGLEGNMPYAAKWLNENYNTMFLTFPMALLRWGKNRLQSLGYALTDIGNETSRRYLMNQAESVLISQAILLAIQILLSQSTQSWLKKKVTGKEDEITEEEEKNAQNILFRGGAVKLFTTAMTGEESTTAGHSRGPVAALFDSYVADFIPAFNDGKSFGEALKNQLLRHTWGHTNFVVKDAVESIPGNKILQSTSWYEPGDNFFDNYARKVLGYQLGYTQANAFMNYMQKSNPANTNKPFLNKLHDGMEYAFSKKYTNIKENKSESRNYKKAFEIVYNYQAALYGDNTGRATTASNNSDLKTKIKNALEFGSKQSDVYNIINEYIASGGSYADVQKTLNSCLLHSKLANMTNYTQFMSSLTNSEKETIKSALLYEEDMFPYWNEIVDYVNTRATQEYARNNTYRRSVGSILNTMNYNTPKLYSRSNSNYKKYKKSSSYLNFAKNNYAYKQKQNGPVDEYNRMQQIQNLGTSTDVWGNETRHYTDGTEYTVRQQGMPIIGGNNNGSNR